jgi:hypothetical protein
MRRKMRLTYFGCWLHRTLQGLSIAFGHPTPLFLPRSGNFLSKATNPLGRA